MAKLEPVYADSFMESRKRKLNTELTCRGVPLPYLIRPRRTLAPFDTFGFYNDYLEDLSDDEDDSSVEAAETSYLDKGNESNAMSHSLNDEKDEDYVVIEHVDAIATPNSQKERAGAIQMMELSKDTVDESDSDDAGSNSSDEWVVV